MRFCPFAQRICLLLDTKQIPYNVTYINLTNKPEWLTKFSSLGKVPALGVPNSDGIYTYLIESLIVADYLNEKYPKPNLYPEDALAKTLDRLLIERFASFYPSAYKIIINGANEAELTLLLNGLDSIEDELKIRESTYFGGTTPGMVDYMIWPFYERIESLKNAAGNDYELKAQRFPYLVRSHHILKIFYLH